MNNRNAAFVPCTHQLYDKAGGEPVGAEPAGQAGKDGNPAHMFVSPQTGMNG